MITAVKENPKKGPNYVVDYERTAAIIVWKNKTGVAQLYKGTIIKSYLNGDFVSTEL